MASCAGNDKKATVNDVDNPVVSNGEILFKSNCAACHKIDKDFTGPALKGALVRWGNDKKAMYDFIRNSNKLIAENAYARQLSKKWAPTIMTSFNLSDAKIDSIMSYCENYVKPKVVSVALP